MRKDGIPVFEQRMISVITDAFVYLILSIRQQISTYVQYFQLYFHSDTHTGAI